MVLFDEETPLSLIKAVRPHALVKGEDYTEEEVVGANEMRSWGGTVVLVPVVGGSSTTEILKRAIASVGERPREFVQ